ncbi:MAG: Fur family transcriptional regulator [Ardenticatenia bacterium]|nr:Fur family transcriptional regulator [Ardenticatenia bacterium]
MSASLHAIFKRIRAEGYKLTRPRRVVIEVLAGGETHMGASEIVAAVRQKAPDVGRASVYRALELLTRLGVVQVSAMGRATTVYMLTPACCHHHLVCVECRRTVELNECALRDLEKSLASRFGFQVQGHLVEIYGRCEACQDNPGSAPL